MYQLVEDIIDLEKVLHSVDTEVHIRIGAMELLSAILSGELLFANYATGGIVGDTTLLYLMRGYR